MHLTARPLSLIVDLLSASDGSRTRKIHCRLSGIFLDRDFNLARIGKFCNPGTIPSAA